MTIQVHHNSRTAVAQPAPLPSWSDDDAWTAELVAEIARGVADAPTRPATRDELLSTYNTTDPVVLRAAFALDVDVKAAERYAAEDGRVAA